MPGDMTPKYRCTNDDCPRVGVIYVVEKGESAECKSCGHFMESVLA